MKPVMTGMVLLSRRGFSTLLTRLLVSLHTGFASPKELSVSSPASPPVNTFVGSTMVLSS
jgi:hypothetical protein